VQDRISRLRVFLLAKQTRWSSARERTDCEPADTTHVWKRTHKPSAANESTRSNMETTVATENHTKSAAN
jgi:hypothetical protein